MAKQKRPLTTGEIKDRTRRIAIDVLEAANAMDDGDWDRAYENILEVAVNNREIMAPTKTRYLAWKRKRGAKRR